MNSGDLGNHGPEQLRFECVSRDKSPEKDESVGPDGTGSLASGSGLQLGTELDCSGRTEGVTWLR